MIFSTWCHGASLLSMEYFYLHLMSILIATPVAGHFFCRPWCNPIALQPSQLYPSKWRSVSLPPSEGLVLLRWRSSVGYSLQSLHCQPSFDTSLYFLWALLCCIMSTPSFLWSAPWYSPCLTRVGHVRIHPPTIIMVLPRQVWKQLQKLFKEVGMAVRK